MKVIILALGVLGGAWLLTGGGSTLVAASPHQYPAPAGPAALGGRAR